MEEGIQEGLLRRRQELPANSCPDEYHGDEYFYSLVGTV